MILEIEAKSIEAKSILRKPKKIDSWFISTLLCGL